LETGVTDQEWKSSEWCPCSRLAAFNASTWLPELCAFMHQGVRGGPSFCIKRPGRQERTTGNPRHGCSAGREEILLFIYLRNLLKGQQESFILVIEHGDIRRYRNSPCQACSVHGLFIGCRQLYCCCAVLYQRPVTAGYAAATGEQYFSHRLQHR